MCKPMSEGGKRCPAHQHSTLAIKQVVRAAFPRIPEQQTNYSFSRLRRQLNNDELSEPTQEQVREFLETTQEQVNRDPNITDRQKQSINNSFTKAFSTMDDQKPDASTFHALRNMLSEGKTTMTGIRRNVTRIANESNTNRAAVYRSFMQNMNNSPRVSNDRYKQNFSPRMKEAFRATRQGITRTREDTRRVERTEYDPNDGIIELGYDPDGGRVEAVDSVNRLHAFHSVSPDDYEKIKDDPFKYVSRLANSPEHKYESEDDAESDAYRIWCNTCQRFHRGDTTICRGTEQRYTPISRTVSDSYRQVIEKFEAQMNVDYTPPEVYWDNADLPEPIELDDQEYDQREGSTPRRHRSTNNSRAACLSDNQITEVREKIKNRQPVTVKLGRDVAVARTNGREHHNVRVPVTITPDRGNVRATIDVDYTNARCTCADYQENGRCKHIYPNEENERINQLLSQDINQEVRRLNDFQSSRHVTVYGGSDYESFNGELDDVSMREIERGIYSGNDSIIHFDDVTTIMLRDNGASLEVVDIHGDLVDPDDSDEVYQKLYNAFSHLGGITQDQNHRDAIMQGWEINEEHRADYYSRFGVSEDNYHQSPENFLSDYREAENRVHSEIPVIKESVTGGFISATGDGVNARGFGVEIEFDADDYNVAETISRELRDAGLADSAGVQGYHQNIDYDSWKVEDDCSVDGGEIVSPVLYDNAESWEQIEKVCKIAKDNGAKVTTRAGGHVHIGRGPNAPQQAYGVVMATAAHQDVIRRLSADTERKEHRSTASYNNFSIPFDNDGVNRIYDSNRRGRSHIVPGGRSHMMNFTNEETIEFRDPDGSLDAGHIQRQVMLASALVRSGEEGNWTDMERSRIGFQKIGSNKIRDNYVQSNIEDNDDRVVSSNISLISALDTLFPNRESRKHMLDVAVRNPWQKSV